MIVVLMCCIFTFSVAAVEDLPLPDGHFATAADLFQYWEGTYPPQYPDYVGGVWTDNGTSYPLTIALTDDAAGKAGKEEILRLLSDDQSVKFTKVTYSRNMLMAAMDDLSQYFEQDLGLVGLGVFDMDNHVGLEIHKDYKKNPATQALLREIKLRYGDAVSIRYTDGYVATTTDILGMDASVDPGNDAQYVFLAVVIAIGMLCTLAVVMTVRHRRTVALQTADKQMISAAEGNATDHRVETVLRNSAEKPSPELEKRIMDQIDR